MHVALLRWEQPCKASVKNAAFPRAISAPCIIKQQLREPSRQRALPIPTRFLESAAPSSYSLRPRPQCMWGGGGLTAPEPPPPPHQPGPWGHALEGQGEPGPGPAVPTSRPGSTRHLSASFRGAGTAPAQTRVIFKELVAAEGSRNRRPGQPRRLCPETQDGGRGAAGQLPARASARPALLRVPVGPQAARVPLSFWGSLRGTRRGGRRAQGGCSGQGRHGTAKRRPAGPAAPPSAGEGGNSL